MPNGGLLLLLHAHLPYVRHPEHEFFLEENWYYEALAETYIPLIEMFERLLNDRVDFGITLSISPTLLEMMSDDLLSDRFSRHLNMLIELSAKEIMRNKKDSNLGPLSKTYHENLIKIKNLHERHFGKNLTAALSRLSKSGRIEIITTSATHAYLPLLEPYPGCAYAQIRCAVSNFTKHLGNSPAGFWLPECGYHEGLDEMLKDSGIKFFFLESHGILHSRPKPKYGIYRPVRCPSGVVAFGRDEETARLVWCAKTGYPADEDYRDFYKDIGFELPLSSLKPFVHPDGIRIATGMKYWRITGNTERKKPYRIDKAIKKAKQHAANFAGYLRNRSSDINERFGFRPLIAAPFDAELFGHWWYEGVIWLEMLLRELAKGDVINTVTPSEFITENRELQPVSPSYSSWGDGGYAATWIDSSNNWAIRDIHMACEHMGELADSAKSTPLAKRAAAQALRELLLSQASDWPFLMRNNSHASYAEKRIMGHLGNFKEIHKMLAGGKINAGRIKELESASPLFPELDYGIFSKTAVLCKGTSSRKKGTRLRRIK